MKPSAIHQGQLPGRILLLATLCVLQGGLARAEPPASSPWNVKTAPAPEAQTPAGTEASMQLRVYEGFDGHRNGPRSDSTPVAIDADISMVTCADGNRQLSSMNIGGVPYDSDNDCSDTAGPGSVRVEDNQERTVIGSAGQASPANEAPAARCNPDSWNCTSPAATQPPAPR